MIAQTMRELIRRRDRYDARPSSCQQIVHPSRKIQFVAGVADHSRSSEHEQASQVRLAFLRDPAEVDFAASSILLRHQTDRKLRSEPRTASLGDCANVWSLLTTSPDNGASKMEQIVVVGLDLAKRANLLAPIESECA